MEQWAEKSPSVMLAGEFVSKNLTETVCHKGESSLCSPLTFKCSLRHWQMLWYIQGANTLRRNGGIWWKHVVQGLRDFNTQISLGNSKTNKLQIRNEVCRHPGSLNRTIHLAMCHPSRIWLFQGPGVKMKYSATSNMETAIFVVFRGQCYPVWTSLVQSRQGLLNHALAVSSDPHRSPACWASCAGERELEQEAGGRRPGARSMCEQSV